MANVRRKTVTFSVITAYDEIGSEKESKAKLPLSSMLRRESCRIWVMLVEVQYKKQLI